MRQTLMNKKHHYFQIHPQPNFFQPSNMIRQHTNMAATLEQAKPTFHHTTSFQQPLSLNALQHTIRSITTWLPQTPVIRLSAAQIQRSQQHRSQPPPHKLVQWLTVITTISYHHLYALRSHRRQFADQPSGRPHFLNISTGNKPRQQQTVLIANRVQSIAPEPFTAKTG